MPQYKPADKVTPAERGRLYAAQGGRCAICGDPPPKGKTLMLDHCHRTGAIRGLLCGHCNSGLGFFKDNPQVLRQAIDYLMFLNHADEIIVKKRLYERT